MTDPLIDAVEKNIARAGEVGVALVLVRQIWSFVSTLLLGINFHRLTLGVQIGPFWFPVMFNSIGLAASAGLCSALMAVFSGFVMAGQHFSEEWRRPRKTG